VPGMIVIARKSAIQGRAVSYKVQIDGRKVGKVRNGTGETFVVAAGSHVVEVKSSGARSKLVTVDVAEAGYHVLGARPTKAGFLAVVPFAWIGGWFGSVAFEKGSPGIALAISGDRARDLRDPHRRRSRAQPDPGPAPRSRADPAAGLPAVARAAVRPAGSQRSDGPSGGLGRGAGAAAAGSVSQGRSLDALGG
jgi:hypothetical protein